MTKVRKITVSRFRGARFDLPLDFSKRTKSVAIFGENASGKSTITDALEWFIHDRVDHLWREDCKQDSLRNVLADDKPSSVELVFDGTDCNGTKALSEALKTTATFASDNAEQLVADLKSDNIILRHAERCACRDRHQHRRQDENDHGDLFRSGGFFFADRGSQVCAPQTARLSKRAEIRL